MADFQVEAMIWGRALRWAIDKGIFGESLLCEEGAETRYRITPAGDGGYSVDWEWSDPFTGRVIGGSCVHCTADTIPAAAADIAAAICGTGSLFRAK